MVVRWLLIFSCCSNCLGMVFIELDSRMMLNGVLVGRFLVLFLFRMVVLSILVCLRLVVVCVVSVVFSFMEMMCCVWWFSSVVMKFELVLIFSIFLWCVMLSFCSRWVFRCGVSMI